MFFVCIANTGVTGASGVCMASAGLKVECFHAIPLISNERADGVVAAATCSSAALKKGLICYPYSYWSRGWWSEFRCLRFFLGPLWAFFLVLARPWSYRGTRIFIGHSYKQRQSGREFPEGYSKRSSQPATHITIAL